MTQDEIALIVAKTRELIEQSEELLVRLQANEVQYQGQIASMLDKTAQARRTLREIDQLNSSSD